MRYLLIVVTLAILLAAPRLCLAQVRAFKAGSAEAQEELARYRERMAQDREEWRKAAEAGKKLFGDNPRYSLGKEAEFRGTLAEKSPPEYSVGDWGCSGAMFEIMNVIGPQEVLVMPQYKDAEPVLIRGVDTSKATNGVKFSLFHPVIIQDTYSYTSVSGSGRTVLVLEVNEKKLTELVEAQRAAAEAALYRVWTDDTGEHTFEGKFLEFSGNAAKLQRKDNGKQIDVPLSRLSQADRDWIRDELKARKDAEREKEKKERAARARAAQRKGRNRRP